MSATPDINLSQIPADAMPELNRQAEAYLDGIVQIAIAADARAEALTSAFAGGSIALCGAAATLGAVGEKFHPVIVASLAGAALLYFAAGMSMWAARPIRFAIKGYQPRKLAGAATNSTNLLRVSTQDLQKRIDLSSKALGENAKWIKWALRTAIMTLPLSALAYFLSPYLHP